jgi:hypothetical protein
MVVLHDPPMTPLGVAFTSIGAPLGRTDVGRHLEGAILEDRGSVKVEAFREPCDGRFYQAGLHGEAHGAKHKGPAEDIQRATVS